MRGRYLDRFFYYFSEFLGIVTPFILFWFVIKYL